IRACFSANSSRRSVSVYPGHTLFTVIPLAPNSFASVLARPVTAARNELERSSPSIGCFTDTEVIVRKRPQRLCCMRGSTSRAKYTVLSSVRSIAARHSSSVMSRNFFAGGPPAFVTHISIRPNLCSTASTKLLTDSKFVTFSACRKICAPLARSISAAVRSSSSAVRAQIATWQPSLANSSATARPNPLLAAATIATRPLNPRSMRLFLFCSLAKVGIVAANPLFASRRKEIDVHSVFQRHRFVRHMCRDNQNFAGADCRRFTAIKIKLQRARQDHCVLLAAMGMARYERAARKQNPRERPVFAAYHLPRNDFA